MHKKIWEPIGASRDAYWSLDKEDGDEKAFCCLYATARDFARLGLLVLHEGRVNGIQVVPEDFITQMVETPKMATDDKVINMRYGWHIWIYKNQGKPVHYFRGLKGQYIIVLPHLNRVIVRLGERRGPHYKLPDHSDLKTQNAEKLGHTIDLFEYLNIADRIVNVSSNK